MNTIKKLFIVCMASLALMVNHVTQPMEQKSDIDINLLSVIEIEWALVEHDNSQFAAYQYALSIESNIQQRAISAIVISKYSCPAAGCNAVFAKRWMFDEHRKAQHAKQKIYSCSFHGCKSRFTTDASMERHIKLQHS